MATVAGLAEVVLNVRDMDAALAFYRDLLGLPVVSPATMANPVFLRAGDAGGGAPSLVVLVQMPAAAASFAAPRTLHHLALALWPGTLPTLEATLTGAGLALRTGIHPTLGLRTLYVFDPDGNEVEFIDAEAT